MKNNPFLRTKSLQKINKKNPTLVQVISSFIAKAPKKKRGNQFFKDKKELKNIAKYKT